MSALHKLFPALPVDLSGEFEDGGGGKDWEVLSNFKKKKIET